MCLTNRNREIQQGFGPKPKLQQRLVKYLRYFHLVSDYDYSKHYYLIHMSIISEDKFWTEKIAILCKYGAKNLTFCSSLTRFETLEIRASADTHCRNDNFYRAGQVGWWVVGGFNSHSLYSMFAMKNRKIRQKYHPSKIIFQRE